MERTPAATACQSASSAGGGDRAALRHQDAPARRTGGERPARELRRRVGLRGIEGGRSHPSPERNVQHCVVFLSPTRRLGRPRSHLSRVPPTYRRFPCDRAKNIRDNIRHKRVGPIPTASVKRYESYSYDDVGLSSIVDGPSPRPPSPGTTNGSHAERTRCRSVRAAGETAWHPAACRPWY